MFEKNQWTNPILSPIPRTTHTMLNELDRLLPGKIAVKEDSRRLTYHDLHRTTLEIGAALLKRGITPGKVVLLDLPMGIPLLICFLAVTRIGAVAFPVHRLLRPEEIEWMIRLAKPILAIRAEFHANNDPPTLQWAELLASASKIAMFQQPDEADPALLRITSGSTGRPKVIQINHRQLCRRISNPGFQYQPDYIYGCPYPYAFPCYHLIAVLGAGGLVVFRPAATAGQIERMILEEKISCFWGTPAMYEQIAATTRPVIKLPSLRLAISSGAHLRASAAQSVENRWKAPLYQAYGQSELGYLTEAGPGTPRESVGAAVAGVKFLIESKEGAVLPPGKSGRILVQTATGFAGYLSGEPLRVDADGWLATGDLGYLDRAGFLYLTGRENDLIHVGGFKVDPLEIAAVISEFNGVKDVLVFGRPHKLRGELVAAAVETDLPLNPVDLRKFCRRRLPRYKCPREIFIFREFPRNVLGKVNRPQLFERLENISVCRQ